MLGAMSSGHDGSLRTVHAGSAEEALRRIETLALMADVGLPHAAVREQVAAAVDLVVHQARVAGGARQVVGGQRGRPRGRRAGHAAGLRRAPRAPDVARAARRRARRAAARGRRGLTAAVLSAGVLCAGLAGATGVAAAWEALGAVEQAAPARTLARWTAPAARRAAAGPRADAPGAPAAGAGLRGRAARRGLAARRPAAPGSAAAAAGPWAVGRVLAARRRRWRAGVAAGAPAAARALADALAGGHSIRGALAEVARTGGAGRGGRRRAAGAAPRRSRSARRPTRRWSACGAARRPRRGTRSSPPSACSARRAATWPACSASLAGRSRGGAPRGRRRARRDGAGALHRRAWWPRCPPAPPCSASSRAPGRSGAWPAIPVAGWLVATAVLLQGFALLAVRRITRLEARA